MLLDCELSILLLPYIHFKIIPIYFIYNTKHLNCCVLLHYLDLHSKLILIILKLHSIYQFLLVKKLNLIDIKEILLKVIEPFCMIILLNQFIFISKQLYHKHYEYMVNHVLKLLFIIILWLHLNSLMQSIH